MVFVETDGPDFTAGLYSSVNATEHADAMDGLGLASMLPHSDLYIVDLKTGSKTLLAKAMGFGSQADADSGKTYLPFGASELHHNYFPTVTPVAQGGYFWVFFDSMRDFGLLGLQRQLWVTALDIQPDGNYTQDVSHPAFYLPGQTFGVGNHRAFAALDACRSTGAACTTGIDCCAGTTCNIPKTSPTDEFGSPVGSCAPPPPQKTCASMNERCASNADCCDTNNYCINGFCSVVELLGRMAE